MTSPPSKQTDQSSDRQTSLCRLELIEVDLVGTSRRIYFHSGLNIVLGAITTGKTTLVRLVRAMLGTMPSGLAPEVDNVKAISGRVYLGNGEWRLYRPRTTTSDALVEISEEQPTPSGEPTSYRLPVASKDRSYSLFLLDQLSIPAVSVPRARRSPTGGLTPVTMTDWLGYCVITGDELDTEVFGHRRDWRDEKRRWVFELAYGFYNPQLALFNAELRSIELQLAALDQNATILRAFLAETPFANTDALESQLAERGDELQRTLTRRRHLTDDADEIPGVQALRQTLLATRSRRAEVTNNVSRIQAQLTDLRDLLRQLSAQSARLTRSVVADEWFVDFDFVVCPRCGSDVHPERAVPDLCYLCSQQPQPGPSQVELLAEQDRVTNQIQETAEIIDAREISSSQLTVEAARLDASIVNISKDLDQFTNAFVSDRASRLQHHASEQARLEGEITRLQEYLVLVRRYQQQARSRRQLEESRDKIVEQIHGLELSPTDADANVQSLERRMLEYLQELHVPSLGPELSVHINRSNYLPEVAGRTFDELSSQGLTTLVNVAHALAHHTVAIDRGLPMPGILVLDGISANAGHEGFDQERVSDVYRLMNSVAEKYRGALQIVAVDNELARAILVDYSQHVVLTLSQEDRLIRLPQQLPASSS